MAEELQSLLDKIQKDGVDKAQEKAQQIITEAKKNAKQIIANAETKAKKTIADAETKASSFQQRAEKALEQTARDIVIGVAQSVNATMKNIVNAEISSSLNTDDLKAILPKVVEAYCNNGSGESNIEILLNPEQQKKIKDFFTSKFASEIKNGLQIKPESSINAGFKVSLVDDNIQHDFTSEAITDAMCQMLRPHLARIMKSAQKD